MNGVITLQANCLYTIDTPQDAANNSGFYINNATVSLIEGNGAVIQRNPEASQFRLLRLNVAGIRVRNLTVRNGIGPWGGGIWAQKAATFENVNFVNNQAQQNSGGLYAQNAVTITGGSFVSNTATTYGGAASFDKAGVVRNARFSSNMAQTGGDGAIVTYGALAVTNSVLARNLAAANSSAAIAAYSSSEPLTVVNSTFADDGLPQTPNPALLSFGPMAISNTVFSNFAIGLAPAGTASTLNSENNNLFVNVTNQVRLYNKSTIKRGDDSRQAASARFVDASNLNFHLLSISPAIDSGANLGPASDADGNPRPFAAGVSDVGAYEYQGTGTASFTVVQTGPPWIAPGAPSLFGVTVYNDGSAPTTNLSVQVVLPANASYVPGSAPTGTLNGNTLMWTVPTLERGQFTRLTYKMVASQTLTLNPVAVVSLNNPAINGTSPRLTVPLNANIVAASGFVPNPDGYGFPNFSSSYTDPITGDLTIQNVVDIFGAIAVCKPGITPCVLNASAEQWRLAWLDFVTGGHCAGMSRTSLFLFLREEYKAEDFGANFTYDIAFASIRRLITKFAVTQTDSPLDRTGLGNPTLAIGAVDVLNYLTATLANPTADRATMSLAKLDGTGGHSVTPCAVERRGADEYWIYVYDNNYPNDFNRIIKVTLSSQSWIYEGATTAPGQPLSTYRGDTSQPTHINLDNQNFRKRFPKNWNARYTPTKSSAFNAMDASASATSASAVSASAVSAEATDVIVFQLDGEGYLLITRKMASGWVIWKMAISSMKFQMPIKPVWIQAWD